MLKRNHVLTTLAVAAMLALPAAASAATYNIDNSHTFAGFKVRHLVVAYTCGEFGEVKGTISYDPANPGATSADIQIDVGSIDTRDEKRDGHLKSPDFFDTAKHPSMTFKSTKVANASKTGFELHGTLTIRGVSKPVVLKVSELAGPVKNPWGMKVVGAHATTTINREDFGLKWNKTLEAGGLLVGNDVHIELNIEANTK